MKTLKPAKRPTLATSRKSASPRDRRAVARGTAASRSTAQTRHAEAPRVSLRGSAETRHQSNPAHAPERPRIDVEHYAAVKNFETGVRAFQKQNYGKAAEIFRKLVDSDVREVAERAQIHLRLCRQRTGRAASLPKSADDFYTLGIACLNAREFGHAVEHLNKADRMKPDQEHVRYALAVSHSLAGNTDAAIAHLEAAFALRPENRIHARRDEDFQGLASDPRFRRLLHSAFPEASRTTVDHGQGIKHSAGSLSKV
jgi:tetratricopeptide (TPR) repeat protein